jgi:hypothetical protein
MLVLKKLWLDTVRNFTVLLKKSQTRSFIRCLTDDMKTQMRFLPKLPHENWDDRQAQLPQRRHENLDVLLAQTSSWKLKCVSCPTSSPTTWKLRCFLPKLPSENLDALLAQTSSWKPEMSVKPNFFMLLIRQTTLWGATQNLFIFILLFWHHWVNALAVSPENLLHPPKTALQNALRGMCSCCFDISQTRSEIET